MLCESQEKSSSYECFHAHNDIVTVALFAPGTARRTHKLPSRAMAQNSKVSVAVPTPREGVGRKLPEDFAPNVTGTPGL